MATTTRRQRQTHGSAWHWKQTDCWYYTPPGTKQRVPLLDEEGQRIRGKLGKSAALLALARLKVAGQWRPKAEPEPGNPICVAQICSEYIESCEQSARAGKLCKEYQDHLVRVLNDWCGYCGALPVAQVTKGHMRHWLESHSAWRSPAAQKNVITSVLSAFHYARENYGLPNPLKGFKKPRAIPRLQSFSADDEAAIYATTDQPFRDFLFAAIHTGLRPYCELAHVTAEDVFETERGMMWRVYASKTKKTRKIPVRPEVAELVRPLLRRAGTERARPLFRNAQGNPWKKVTGVGRFGNIRRRLGWNDDPLRKNYSSYTARHTFAHRMLSGYWNGGAGCSIEVLAELMGDTPKVAFDHYGKEWGQHYQEPLWAAVGMGAK